MSSRRKNISKASAEELQAQVRALLDEMDYPHGHQQQQQQQWQEALTADSGESYSIATWTANPTLTLLLPLLILLSTLLFLLIFFLVFLIVLRRKRRGGIALRDTDGPLDLSREEELEGDGGIQGVEERWLEQQEDGQKTGYDRAKRE